MEKSEMAIVMWSGHEMKIVGWVQITPEIEDYYLRGARFELSATMNPSRVIGMTLVPIPAIEVRETTGREAQPAIPLTVDEDMKDVQKKGLGHTT